jgi:hypothetical protein
MTSRSLLINSVIVLGLAVISSSAPTQQASTSTPEFSGTWVYPFCCGFGPPLSGAGPVVNKLPRVQVFDADGLPIRGRGPIPKDNFAWIGDYTNPVLKPAAAEVVKKKGEIEESGVTAPTPRNECWPEGVPFIFDNMGMMLLQQPNKITIFYEHDHQVRHIHLNQVHPAQVSQSWYGDSVGHYEGDTLVIDTVGLKIGPFSMVDWYGAPYTQALHVTERYRLVEDDESVKRAEERGATNNFRLARRASAATGIAADRNYKGKVLQLEFVVEDPGVFTMPWAGTVIYRRSSDEWPEHVCAENPGRSPGTPTAEKADF